MNLTVYQQINIHQLKVDAVTNSSFLQVGTAGKINTLSKLYNTGGFVEPAEEIEEAEVELSLVPLPSIR